MSGEAPGTGLTNRPIVEGQGGVIAKMDRAASRIALAGRVLCLVLPPAIWFAPVPIAPAAKHALAIAALMIVAWISQAAEYALAGLVGCFLFWALHVTPFSVAFGGFANDTPWFLFGALLLGTVATRSGVARRLAYLVMLRIGTTYPRILLGLIVTDLILTLIVPSGIARVVILAAIALGLAEAFGAARGSNVARGMFLIITYTANIFDKMIIAGAASITARGLIERVGEVEVLWSRWALAFLPCSLLTVLVAWRMTIWLYPPESVALKGGREHLEDALRRMGPWSVLEKRCAILIAAAVLMWMTDFIHHISPAVIGIGVGLFALLPNVGVLEVDEMRRLNYLPVFFVATAVSMGGVLEATKALDVLTGFTFALLEPAATNMLATTVIMYWTAFVYHFFLASEISMLATSIPLVMAFAKTHAMSPLLLGMIWTFAAGGKLFVYQSGVLIVGYSYGYFAPRDLLRVGFALTIAEFVILLLLVPLYWPLLGLV